MKKKARSRHKRHREAAKLQGHGVRRHAKKGGRSGMQAKRRNPSKRVFKITRKPNPEFHPW